MAVFSYIIAYAGVTQLVECNLAKVDVEGSNPFTRSKTSSDRGMFFMPFSNEFEEFLLVLFGAIYLPSLC